MIQRVAQEVNERIADLVENGAIQLDFLAFHLELHLLVQLTRDIARFEDLASASAARTLNAQARSCSPALR